MNSLEKSAAAPEMVFFWMSCSRKFVLKMAVAAVASASSVRAPIVAEENAPRGIPTAEKRKPQRRGQVEDEWPFRFISATGLVCFPHIAPVRTDRSIRRKGLATARRTAAWVNHPQRLRPAIDPPPPTISDQRGVDAWAGRDGWRAKYAENPTSRRQGKAESLEQRPPDRPETPPAAQAGLGDPCSPRIGGQFPGSGTLQSRD